ncbi:GINS complex, Sld5 component [Rhizopus microsporus]
MRGTLFLVFSLLFFFLIMNSTIEDSSFPQTQDDIFNLAGALSPGEQVKELIVVWMNERNSPEMLPYRNDLVDSLTKAVEHQSEKIFEQMEINTDTESRFIQMIQQTEIERIKYLLRSYLRTRLFKIEKFSLHLLRQPDVREILSEPEYDYAQKYQELIEAHGYSAFLHQLPASQQRQDEETPEGSMVVQPNLDAPVFASVLADRLNIQTAGEMLELEKGDLYMLRYIDVRDFLSLGQVRLV